MDHYSICDDSLYPFCSSIRHTLNGNNYLSMPDNVVDSIDTQCSYPTKSRPERLANDDDNHTSDLPQPTLQSISATMRCTTAKLYRDHVRWRCAIYRTNTRTQILNWQMKLKRKRYTGAWCDFYSCYEVCGKTRCSHEECPLGKLFRPSMTWSIVPEHSISAFIMPSGKHRQKKSGRGRPSFIITLLTSLLCVNTKYMYIYRTVINLPTSIFNTSVKIPFIEIDRETAKFACIKSCVFWW